MSFDNTTYSVSVEKRYSAKDPSVLVSVRLTIFKGRLADGTQDKVLAPGENRQYGPGENRQFQPNENRQCIF